MLEKIKYLTAGESHGLGLLGIVEGNMEVGPRALGHRSIICDPSVKGIKDKL